MCSATDIFNVNVNPRSRGSLSTIERSDSSGLLKRQNEINQSDLGKYTFPVCSVFHGMQNRAHEVLKYFLFFF